MKKGLAIFTAVLAVVFGIVLGLAQAEDEKYSYKM